MKHIKTLESWFSKTKYDIGDYVLLKPKVFDFKYGKIISKFKNNSQYLISDESFSDDVFKCTWCHPSNIKRKLNAKELVEVKFKEDSKKYNL